MSREIRQLRRDLGVDDDREPRITGGEPALLRDPRRGFRHAGEFFQAVHRAGRSDGAVVDERLAIIRASTPTTVGNEVSGVDGGFAVPAGFGTRVDDLIMEQSLLPLFDVARTDSNEALFPNDTTTPWGTAGVRASWQLETTALAQIKPQMGGTQMRLQKLLAFVPVSDELFEDSALLGPYLTGAAGEACSWKASDAFINGLGNGTPMGILQSKALLVQAKDSGQATATISATNVSGMIGKLLPGSLGRAVWLVDQTAVPALVALGATNYPMTFASDDAFVGDTQIPCLGYLVGRPVVVTQHCAAFSSQGDLLLVDPMAYRVLIKNGSDNGLEVDLSLDVFFDAFAAAFRFRFRVDGQSKYPATITTAKGGTNAVFVALGAR